MKKFMADQFKACSGDHFVKKFIASAVMAIFCLVLGSAKPAWSAEIALYNPDTLTSSATPTVGADDGLWQFSRLRRF
jgi:hypothetical protein